MDFTFRRLLSYYIAMFVLLSPCCRCKENPRCCFPDVFEAFIGVDAGTNAQCAGDVYKNEFRLYYDYPNRRWGVIHGKELRHGGWTGYMVTEDYNKREITRAKEFCIISSIKENWQMNRFCLPEDAEYLETVTMGFGEHSLTYDTWTWSKPITLFTGEQTTMYVTTGVTDDCTFINEIALWKEDNGRFNATNHFAFFNIKDGRLSANNVFYEVDENIECRNSESLHVGNSSVLS
ncbi:hypothetical protein LSH36_809g01001 [Paralvinella palmiformis]|uniref:Uncharacterized protein n=1 Tax=Paralvinella palmiformis TaxID=53620 RepID=A0AAD9IZK8_9ANNE|nr:hypothetical protein LSH36_809g01001 [Paralvinella palmiformis]